MAFIGLSPLPLLIGIFGLIGIGLIIFFGIKSIDNKNKRYWLTGGIIGLLIWIILLSSAFNCEGFFCIGALKFLMSSIPAIFVFNYLFGTNNESFLIIFSNIINVVLLFFLGVLLGKLVMLVINLFKRQN